MTNIQLPELVVAQQQSLGTQGNQIFVACDPSYLKEHAVVLAHSLEQNAPNNSLHLHIFGHNQYVINEIDTLKQDLHSTRVTWSYEQIEFNDKNSQAIYCACVRFIRLTQLIHHFKVPILSLDADSLVINSLHQLTEETKSCDVALKTRFHMEQIQFKFLTSSVFFMPTENTLQFLNQFSQLIWNAIATSKAYWYLDQVSFYQAAQTFPNLVIQDISTKYADWEFDDDSYIWAGKGERKYRSEVYTQKVKQIRQKNLNYTTRFDITHIFRADSTNVGDWYCPPFRYLPLYTQQQIDIYNIKDELPSSPILLIGGGGLISPSFPQLQKLVQAKNKLTIGWGIGHNMIVDKKPLGYIPPCELKFPDYINDFGLLGIRDYTEKYTWTPCASCFYEGFNKQYQAKHEIIVYEHKRVPLGIEGFPLMTNEGNNITKILAFLGSGNVIITNSYHGAYWAILLGKRVVVIPFSSKCYGFKYQIPSCKPNGWKKQINKTECHPNALSECRQANLDFFYKVERLLWSL